MNEIAQILRNGSSSYVSWVTTTMQSPETHIQGPYNKTARTQPRSASSTQDGAGPGWYKIPEYNLYGQFMRFIRPGAVRIGTSDPGSEDTTTNVAFKNPMARLSLWSLIKTSGRRTSAS